MKTDRYGWLRVLAYLCLLFLGMLSVSAQAQTHSYCPTDGVCTYTGAHTFTNANSVLNATQYASGSNTCGIAEAYAAGASTGVSMVMSSDCTISMAQTITTTLQKPLYLSLQGHTISCANASGACIALIKPDSTPRTGVVIGNGRIVYIGASASVTGLKIGSQAASATDVVLRDLAIDNFNTVGATALDLDNAEDCAAYSVKLNGNTLALKLDKFTNNNQFFGLNIQGGVQAISMTDASGNNFIGGLIQSNTGVRTITQTSSTIAISGNTFEDVWMENNGDTTANSRVFYNFATGTAHNIASFASLNNTINVGLGGALGKVYEFTGDSTSATFSPILKGNNYGGYAVGNIITGSLVYPTSVEGENATFAEAGINLNGQAGFHYWPLSGGHHFWAHAGDSNVANNNNWLMEDTTAGTVPLLYKSSDKSWTFPAGGYINIGANGVLFNGATSGTINVVAAAIASGTLTLPAATDTLIGKATTDTLTNKTLTAPTITGAGAATFATYSTATNCASSGGTCVAASAGRVSIAAAATTVTVATTAVTANSEIFIQEDATLGTALSVTCNTTTGRTYTVTTRTAGTSFVITASAAPTTNPACLSFRILN